jgi:hypothetical protein
LQGAIEKKAHGKNIEKKTQLNMCVDAWLEVDSKYLMF